MSNDILKAIISGDILTKEQIVHCMKDYHNRNADWSEKYFLRPSKGGESSYQLLANSGCKGNSQRNKLLDLGCGIGTAYSVLLESGGSNLEYTGIDVSERCIAIASSRFRDKPDASFIEASATELPFETGNFDSVISHMAFMLFRPAKDALSEVARILKQGGSFSAIIPAVWAAPKIQNTELVCKVREIISENYPNFKLNNGGIGEKDFFSVDAIEEIFRSNGNFSEVKLQEFEVDFSGPLEEVLWGIKTFYWFQVLTDDKKRDTELKLSKTLQKLVDARGHIHNSRTLCLINCTTK